MEGKNVMMVTKMAPQAVIAPRVARFVLLRVTVGMAIWIPASSAILEQTTELLGACRAGYRADGLLATDSKQFRLNFPGQEYRVFVAPGIDCNTLCDHPFPGPQSCMEVPVQPNC